MRPIRRSRMVLAAGAFAAWMSAEPAVAAYDFVVLADSTGPVAPSSSIVPSIDEDGAVAFVATLSGVQNILVARDPGATSAGDYESFASGRSYRSVGSFVAGRLAYTDFPTAPPFLSSVFRTDSAVPIYTGGGAGEDPPSLNGLGQTAVFDTSQGQGRIIVTDGEDTAVIAEYEQQFGNGWVLDHFNRPAPDIDGVGRVAYYTSIRADSEPFPCDDKILLSGLNPPIELSEGGVLGDDCPFFLLDILVPIALNDAGNAAFAGNFQTPSESVNAVFVDRTVFWEERSPGFENFVEVRSVALNDPGLVAYLLFGLSGTGTVLFTGRPPNHDRVLGAGDALCDGTVSSLAFQRSGLNDAGELALNVLLTSGRRLIVRAEPTLLPDDRCITVPEPGALATALAALAALSGRTRARRSPFSRDAYDADRSRNAARRPAGGAAPRRLG